MLSVGFDTYWKWERRLVPTLQSSQVPYAQLVLHSLRPESHWVDLGCGHHVFGSWMAAEQAAALARCRLAVGVDRDWTGLVAHCGFQRKIAADGRQLPLRTGSVDLLTANMVVEHLDDPVRVLREVARVLTPSGRCIIHTPNRAGWPTICARWCPTRLKHWCIRILDGRPTADVFPTYYRLNTQRAIEDAARQAGLTVQITLLSSSALFGALGTWAVGELLFLRALQRPALARWRSTILAVFEPAHSTCTMTGATICGRTVSEKGRDAGPSPAGP